MIRFALHKKTRSFCLRSFASIVAIGVLTRASALFAAEEAQKGLDPLDWKGDLAIWTAVVFLLLLLALAKFAFGPIVKALDQREQKELDRIAAAEKANADAKELLEQYRQKISDSGEEVRRILADARVDAQKQAEDIVGQAKLAAETERERAVKDIQIATDAAVRDIAVKSAQLAVDLAGKIIREKIELDPDKRAQLVASAVDDLTEKTA